GATRAPRTPDGTHRPHGRAPHAAAQYLPASVAGVVVAPQATPIRQSTAVWRAATPGRFRGACLGGALWPGRGRRSRDRACVHASGPGLAATRRMSYLSVVGHRSMALDANRNAAYGAALRQAIGPDTVVLDLGAGTGIHGLMAAKL